tara:strand:- start:6 stop:314 length:309 start_codon:yes stop_codon:yes gene_type:complete
MRKIVEKPVNDLATDSDLFAPMGLIKFWFIYTLFYLTFPILIVIRFVVLGPRLTRQLISASAHDFLQTILLLLMVVVVLSWGVWHFLAPLSWRMINRHLCAG